MDYLKAGTSVLPRFSNLQADRFSVDLKSALAVFRAQIAQIETIINPTWTNTVVPLEESAESLDRIWSQLEHLNSVASTPEIRQVYEELLPLVTNFHTELLQNTKIYRLLEIYSATSEFKELSVAQQKIITNELRNFKLAGVDLPAEKALFYKKLVERLSSLENQFANNLLDATEGWHLHVTPDQVDMLAGLPSITLAAAQQKAQALGKNGWVLTLDHPCYYAVQAYAQDREMRHIFYVAYSTRASDQGPTAGKWDNTPVLKEILEVRQQLANLVGYKNYVEYSLVPKMASNIQQVNGFLQDLVRKVKPKATLELAEVFTFAEQADGISDPSMWDLTYYGEKYKQLHFKVSEEELRVYFPEPRVLTGLFKLVRQIFGLQIEEVADFEKWHSLVRLFKVLDQNNQLRGYFYIDLYTRDGKRDGAWMADCLSRIRFADNTLQLPVAYLNCNFVPPSLGNPGLLTHNDVITLFHEFGHTLHHVLTQIDYYSVAGMNGVEWDAVELPSQFMENWCWEWGVIQDISENIHTGDRLPRAEFDKLLSTKNFHSGLFLLKQLEFTLFDLRAHANSPEDTSKSAQEILAAVRKEVSVIMVPEFNRFPNSFGHIFAGGYAAGYYSYLWAEVLSCDAFDLFRARGMFNSEVGREFLKGILEMGGSKPAMQLFVAFAGREPEVDALLRHHGIL